MSSQVCILLGVACHWLVSSGWNVLPQTLPIPGHPLGLSLEVFLESSVYLKEVLQGLCDTTRFIYVIILITVSNYLDCRLLCFFIVSLLAVDCKLSEGKDLVFLSHHHCLQHLELGPAERKRLFSICWINKKILLSYSWHLKTYSQPPVLSIFLLPF